MSWTAAIDEGYAKTEVEGTFKTVPLLNVRAIIDVDNGQAELKDLIASLQKHVKEGT